MMWNWNKHTQTEKFMKWRWAERKRNSCQRGGLHKHTLGRSWQTKTGRFSRRTHNRRCKHTAGFPRHRGSMCLPGTAEGHQPVFVVDSHAGTVSHICRPDSLQLLRPHKKLITEWMWLWDRGQVSGGLHFTVPFKPTRLFTVSLRKQLLWTRMMLNTHFLILRRL